VDLTRAVWRKGSQSQSQGQCVEVAHVEGLVAVRDSKNPDGNVLLFTRSEWSAFLGGVANGEFHTP
jgi:hypothetical protein